MVNNRPQFEAIRIPQHKLVVETIKNARVRDNLDCIGINNGKLKYECVWVEDSNPEYWHCFFALDIYGWRDLAPAYGFPRCGCAGLYAVPKNRVPKLAMKIVRATIKVPNRDPLDPFGP